MNTVVWIMQIVLAVLFLLLGGLKVVLPLPALQRIIPLAKRIPTAMRWIGKSEVLGVLGLLLPGLTGIQPWLTFTAALGLTIILIGALVVHLQEREFAQPSGTEQPLRSRFCFQATTEGMRQGLIGQAASHLEGAALQ